MNERLNFPRNSSALSHRLIGFPRNSSLRSITLRLSYFHLFMQRFLHTNFAKNAFWCKKKKALYSLQRASIRKETVPEGTVSYYSTGNLREIYANAFAPAALASAANLGSPNSGLCRCLATIRVPVPYAHSSGGLIISAPDPLITFPFSSLESFIHL